MSKRTLTGSLKYLIFLILFILCTFAPHVYAKAQELIGTENFKIASFMEIFDPVAIATILLATATFALARDSGKNIEISKYSLLGDHLERDMEELIKPIYMERNRLESRELVHIPYYDETHDFMEFTDEAHGFWDLLEANSYLAPKDLRDIIINYSICNEEWDKKRNDLANEIHYALEIENRMDLCIEAPRDRYLPVGPVYFDYRFINLPLYNEKSERKDKIQELTARLEPNSNSRHLIEKFQELIDADTQLKTIRELFKERIISRYKELEKMIDEIREALENG